jgi:hypothetical protein
MALPIRTTGEILSVSFLSGVMHALMSASLRLRVGDFNWIVRQLCQWHVALKDAERRAL